MAKFTRMIPLLCALFLFCLCGCHQNIPDTTSSIEETQSPDSKFTYPITPDSDDWNKYSYRRRYEMAKIPDETLATMSCRDLVEALATYPFLNDIYAEARAPYGIERLRINCSALDELLKRDGGTDAISEYLRDDSVEDLSDFQRVVLQRLYSVIGSAVFQGTLNYPT